MKSHTGFRLAYLDFTLANILKVNLAFETMLAKYFEM